ncbi:Sodium/calcium exchanger protein-domain-containing protein [Limtongia smithiae]|uniref:Sodium/calcium exchanger protein-domain-containing protein n=1 Tax=Limtongia smithiae TaxID=1125753 RepID=UPI0034CE3770
MPVRVLHSRLVLTSRASRALFALAMCFALVLMHRVLPAAAAASSPTTRSFARSPLVLASHSPRELFSFTTNSDGLECIDVGSVLREDQCAFVRTHCAGDAVGFFNYLEFYYCVIGDLHVLGFLVLTLWLIAVFTTIGITASDFLCPNLSTIADLLGMSESFAGVTFLALGNGSPDVFSTYAAMKAGSGSLAVGELIGAASFITSVVAGAMAIICPFTVDAGTFTRDLGFFTIAVAFALACLSDGRIELWECTAMVGFYLMYVGFVVAWHWIISRWMKKPPPPPSRTSSTHTTAASATSDTSANSAATYYSDLVNSPGMFSDIQDLESTPLLGESSSPTPSFEINRAVDRYALRSMHDHRYYPPDEPARFSSYLSESPMLASSAPIRPSLVSALDLRSAVERGRKANRVPLDEGTVSRHFKHKRSVSGVLPNEQPNRSGSTHKRKPSSVYRHSHKPSANMHVRTVSSATQYSLSSSVRSHSHLRPMSENDATDGAYFSDGSRPSSRARAPHAPTSYDRRHLENTQNLQGVSQHSEIRPPSLPPPPPAYRDAVPISVGHSTSSTSLHRQRPSLSLAVDGFERRRSNPGISPSPLLTPASPNVGRRPLVRQNSGRQSRSPSPYVRFLSFQPPLATAQPEIPHGASRIHEEDLLSLDDASSRVTETRTLLSPVAGSGQTLELPFSATQADVLSDISEGDTSQEQQSGWGRWCCASTAISDEFLKTLFPTVERLQEKTNLNKFVSILAVPSVLLLTVTIPVIEVERVDPEPEHAEDYDVPALHVNDIMDDAGVLMPADHYDSDSDDSKSTYKGWNKWLVGAQCVFAPLSVLLLNMYDDPSLARHAMYVVLGGLSMFCTILYFTDAHSVPVKLLPILCFVGFIVSISWIASVAVEVVGVLKAYGVIFGISDAILGLTVFALGNSLGDFVSNITVAKMGYPMMAISACFGSPMLNILIGIGVSGLLLMRKGGGYTDGEEGYKLEIASSLVVSAATLFLNLLLFLVGVPLSHWRMTRIIGIASLAIWTVGTATNVILEIMSV